MSEYANECMKYIEYDTINLVRIKSQLDLI